MKEQYKTAYEEREALLAEYAAIENRSAAEKEAALADAVEQHMKSLVEDSNMRLSLLAALAEVKQWNASGDIALKAKEAAVEEINSKLNDLNVETPAIENLSPDQYNNVLLQRISADLWKLQKRGVATLVAYRRARYVPNAF